MEHAAPNTARSLAEISWIFMKYYRQNRIAPKITTECISIGGAETLEVSLRTLSVSWITILCLADAGIDRGSKEDERIGRALPHEMKFLFRAQRWRICIIYHVEIGHDSQNPLFLFLLEVLGCLIVLLLRLCFLRCGWRSSGSRSRGR